MLSRFFACCMLVIVGYSTHGQNYKKYSNVYYHMNLLLPDSNFATGKLRDSCEFDAGDSIFNYYCELFHSTINNLGSSRRPGHIDTRCDDFFYLSMNYVFPEAKLKQTNYIDGGKYYYAIDSSSMTIYCPYSNKKGRYRKRYWLYFYHFSYKNKYGHFVLYCTANKDKYPNCEEVIFKVAKSVSFD